MKVSELIELLEEQDPDAEVLVMSQPNWPYAERRIMRTIQGAWSVLRAFVEGC
jgi:hypothetical protein